MSARLRRTQVAAVMLIMLAVVTELADVTLSMPWWALGVAEGCLIAAGLRQTEWIYRIRCEQDSAREKEAERRARHREALLSLSAPDAGPGQCPVCALDDLEQLASDDRFLDRQGTWRRVAPYGRGRAHQECAELVPYKPSPRELREQSARQLCDEERRFHQQYQRRLRAQREQLLAARICVAARGRMIPKTEADAWHMLGFTQPPANLTVDEQQLTMQRLSRALTNVFSVPTMDLDPVRGPTNISPTLPALISDPERRLMLLNGPFELLGGEPW